MVSREKRSIAERVIFRFASGEISNEDFEDTFPVDSADPALRAIQDRLWYFYDDLSTHTLTGKHALTLEGSALFERCRTFLMSDREYEWPPNLHRPSIANLLFNGFSHVVRLVGLKKVAVMWTDRIDNRLRLLGDYDSWPFLRVGDHA